MYKLECKKKILTKKNSGILKSKTKLDESTWRLDIITLKNETIYCI